MTIGELTEKTELLVKVSALRAEADRMRPVYVEAKAWRERIRSRPEAFRQGVVVGLSDALVAAIDVAVATEDP